jgi:hypothetical protein
MRIRYLPLLSLLAFAILGAAAPALAQAFGPPSGLPANVMYVPAHFMVNSSGMSHPAIDQNVRALTAAEIRAVRMQLAALPAFPPNPYSGCHARAEYLARQLAGASGNNLFKVWVFAGRVFAPSLTGSIAYRPQVGPTTDWGYHVAAAFRDRAGTLWVIDPLVADAPIRVADWLKKFTITGPAILTERYAGDYQFNMTVVPADPQFPLAGLQFMVAKNMFSGTMWRYAGPAAANHQAAGEIATDAVSSALVRNRFPGCEWTTLVTQSLELNQRLVATMPTPSGCEGARQLYEQERALWVQRGL